MALGICSEALVRLLALEFKFFMDHWFLSLIFFAISIPLARRKIAAAVYGWVLARMSGAAVGATILSGGILGFLGGLAAGFAFAFIMGLFWAVIAFSSRANIILRLFSLPFFLVAGLLWGLLPIPVISWVPLTGAIAFAMDHKLFANVVCAAVILFAVAAIFTPAGQESMLCMMFNSALKVLS